MTKSISFLVLQRVLKEAMKTLKMNAATSDFSVINYEEAKFVITLKDGRKYTVTITPENDSS
jgi:RNase P/RNase MRP subunit p29